MIEHDFKSKCLNGSDSRVEKKNLTASDRAGCSAWLIFALRGFLFAVHHVAQAPHCALSVTRSLKKEKS